jgi:tetratricopeptide (TPR) repeat protein
VVVLAPDEVPAGGGEAAVLDAAAGLERAGRPAEAAIAYSAALRRWPGSLGAMIGRGNAHYAAGDLASAETAYRAAIERHPEAAVAWNNLADLLAARGARVEAVLAAERAIGLGGPHAETYRRTLAEITAGAA